MAHKGAGKVGTSQVIFRDKPRLISAKRQRWERQLDEELGRRAPEMKKQISLPSLGDWGKNAFDE